MFRSFSIALVCLGAMSASAGAQNSPTTGSVVISAKVGGKSYQSSGQGSCRHTPTGAIYGVPAALWMVALTGSGNAAVKSMSLTLWKPKDGSPQQLSLSLDTGRSTHRIEVGGRGSQAGSGKAKVVATGEGGRIELSGKDESGKTLDLVVDCPTFADVEAEGG